ncbi:hypothetical protein OG898_01525 [Streptomyces sp. NBC_00193]|uniref:hypothetical protein n=1 Tax=Streptomyces sp. NBC_00193 TaxID=2975675 RepID=UPI00224DB8FC|nr:hypothetical protein [Streptomyces sp. NBC_00193]MCX5295173.1 hypothetical protein [Streptomyces sp. NBC_00193]
MARNAGRRARRGDASREQLQQGSPSQSGRASAVVIVVAGPADAVPLINSEPAGSVIELVWLDGAAAAEQRAMEAAVAQAKRRGCRFPGEPFLLYAADGNLTGQILDVLHEIEPVRVRTLDPDPVHTDVDRESKLPIVSEPAARGQVARSTLRAARRYQLAVGTPVFVDCRRAGADPALPAAACSRYPRPTQWLLAGKDGRLSAYLPTAAGVVRWTEGRTEAEGWSGPELLQGPELMPGLTVLRGPEGYAYLIGLSRTKRKDSGSDVEVVYAAQYQTGRPLGPWTTVGNPNAASWHKARETGFPVATFDADGVLHVFVRNFGHSVSVRRQTPKGRMTGWEALGGLRVADELVAFPAAQGGVHMVARARDTASAGHFFQQDVKAAWVENRRIPVSPYPGSLSVAPESGVVRFRYAGSNEVCVWWPGAQVPIGLGGPEGLGPVAGVAGADIQGWGCTVLVREGAGGVTAIGAHPDGRPDIGVWWEESGEPSVVPPAAAFDSRGRVVIATVGMDGTLRVARQQLGSQGLEFTPWTVH